MDYGFGCAVKEDKGQQSNKFAPRFIDVSLLAGHMIVLPDYVKKMSSVETYCLDDDSRSRHPQPSQWGFQSFTILCKAISPTSAGDGRLLNPKICSFVLECLSLSK